MGACIFKTKSIGKTAEEAFRKAVDQAAWEYGHGGYTGTIAEKSSFTIIADKPQALAAKFPDGPLKEALSLGSTRSIADALIELYDSRIDDKWGPAGCVQTGPEEFLFFGLASS